MKKSILSAVIPKSLRRKADVKNDTVVGKTTTSQKADAAKLSLNKSKTRENTLSSVTSSTSSFPTTTLYKPGADYQLKSKEKMGDERRKTKHVSGDDGGGCTGEEDIEYDEEVVRKLLERKVEQAPAAKVVVSDAMMREALSEMNLRKSGLPTSIQSPIHSADVDNFSRREICGEELTKNRVARSSSASVSVLTEHHQSTKKVADCIKNEGGGGDAAANIVGSISENESSLSMNATAATQVPLLSAEDGLLEKETICPLEKIIEFLQAVMTKDYKRALVLAKEVEKHEPNNELVLEYMTVLQQIIKKEEEYDDAEDSDSDTNEAATGDDGEFTDELTTSSETDGTSHDEDSESFATESRSSSTSTTSSSSEEDDDDEEGYDGELEMTLSKDSKDNKKEENVLVENDVEEKSAESLDADGNDTTSCCGLSEHEREPCKDNTDDAKHTTTTAVSRS